MEEPDLEKSQKELDDEIKRKKERQVGTGAAEPGGLDPDPILEKEPDPGPKAKKQIRI